MTYELQDIELMITDMPRDGKIPSLDIALDPQRRHLASRSRRIHLHTRPRKTITSLIDYFQENPIDSELDNSGIPYFLADLKLQYPNDRDVRRLFEIPNIDLLR